MWLCILESDLTSEDAELSKTFLSCGMSLASLSPSSYDAYRPLFSSDVEERFHNRGGMLFFCPRRRASAIDCLVLGMPMLTATQGTSTGLTKREMRRVVSAHERNYTQQGKWAATHESVDSMHK